MRRRLARTANLAVAAYRDLDGVLARMDEQADGGLPASVRSDTDRTSGFTTVLDEDGNPVPGVADHVGERVAAAAEGKTAADRAAEDRVKLEGLVSEIHGAASQLERLMADYLAAKRAHEARNPGCQLCAEQSDEGWSEIHRRSDCGGILTTAGYEGEVPLCRWHYDFVRSAGRPTTRPETIAHLAGERVKTPPPRVVLDYQKIRRLPADQQTAFHDWLDSSGLAHQDRVTSIAVLAGGRGHHLKVVREMVDSSGRPVVAEDGVSVATVEELVTVEVPFPSEVGS